jgi:acyl-CoA reductase-like NAD-dependent aldehyde dehydrogenase
MIPLWMFPMAVVCGNTFVLKPSEQDPLTPMLLAELALQLRGEAGPRQVKGAEIALAENGGGVIGMEEAVASVVILQKV